MLVTLLSASQFQDVLTAVARVIAFDRGVPVPQVLQELIGKLGRPPA
jgi:hypothetical protein